MDENIIQLSPSSASNFKSCPLLFKYRNIDRLEEPISTRQAGGSLVHAVLERLFAQDPQERTRERANYFARCSVGRAPGGARVAPDGARRG